MRSATVQSLPSTTSSHLQSSLGTSWIKLLVVSMNGNVEDVGIVVECFLSSVTYGTTNQQRYEGRWR